MPGELCCIHTQSLIGWRHLGAAPIVHEGMDEVIGLLLIHICDLSTEVVGVCLGSVEAVKFDGYDNRQDLTLGTRQRGIA